MITVNDIYVGKPDARDEVIFDGYDNFIKSFVVPPNFDENELLLGNKCFVRGYKGTGKTALLFYLQEQLLAKDPSAHTSFLLFKDQYKATQRKELTAISSKIVRAIDASEATSGEQDFEYIWRWIFLKQIIEDNEFCNFGLFEKNAEWNKFSDAVNKILSDSKDAKYFKIPQKVKIGIDYAINQTGGQSVSPNLEVNFEDKENLKEYSLFTKQIDLAMDLMSKLKRSDIPYFTFVDELEAFFSDEDLMKRDLQLIRDLIITVKYFNQFFVSNQYQSTKIIASVRTEIINSISRFIPGKEINKIVSGFECPVLWDYNNTNSYAHPIIQIWLKRISVSSIEASSMPPEAVYKLWFPEKIDGIEPANYILNNSWSKPRDVVRFLSSAKSSIQSSQKAYTSAVFSASMKEYSTESKREIVEEMNSLYSADKIDAIFSCLRGYKAVFSFNELKERVKLLYAGTFLDTGLMDVVRDLYRLGVIGNYHQYTKAFRWQHKGDEDVLFADDWKLFVHRALQKDLSISVRWDKSVARIKSRQKQADDFVITNGTMVDFTIEKILPTLVIGSFPWNDTKCDGTIHISQITNTFVDDINSYLHIGQSVQAVILEKNSKRTNSYRLTTKHLYK